MENEVSHADQLRDLRRRLSNTDKPASQSVFAKITGVSADMVRAIEIRRRNITPETRLEIFRTTGAYWDDKEGQWLFRYGPAGPKPFEYSDFEAYHKLYEDSPVNQEDDLKVMGFILQELFEAVKGPAHHHLVDEIHQALEQVQKKLNLPDDLLTKYWPTLIVDRDAFSGKLLNVSRQYRPEIMDRIKAKPLTQY
jgi:hypothetical protein